MARGAVQPLIAQVGSPAFGACREGAVDCEQDSANYIFRPETGWWDHHIGGFIMGAAKQLMMEMEELHEIALHVLCAAGVIKECEWHSGEYLEAGGSGDLELTYRIANARITAGEIDLPGDFTRRDLTDKIKELGEMYWPETCGYCDKD